MPRRDPDVRPRPDEAIEFGKDDPAGFAIEAESFPHAERNLERVTGLLWLGVGDRRRQQLGLVAPHGRRNDHDDRPILATAFLAPRGLARPQIRIEKDVSGLGDL
jgi:hypothetical protein